MEMGPSIFEAFLQCLHWQVSSKVSSCLLNLWKFSHYLLSGYSLWAKDIVLVVSDNHLDGMHAWLAAYHGSTQSSE